MSAITPVLVRSLREDADAVGSLVAQVAASLEQGPCRDGGEDGLQSLRSCLPQVEDLRARLDEAARVLRAWQSHSQWESDFGSSGWDDRLLVLHSELARDTDVGTQACLSAWSHALAVGAWDEAQRLSAEPLPLADRAAWWQERAVAILDAVRGSTDDPSRSVTRLADAVALLAELTSPKRVADVARIVPVADLLRLVLLNVRVALRAGDEAVGPRLQAARSLLPRVPRRDGPAAQHAVLAATSAVLRLGAMPQPEQTGDFAGLPATDLDWLEALREAPDLDCAVELVVRAAAMAATPGQDSPPDPLAEAAVAVRALPSVAGVRERLQPSLEAAPDELVVELAARLADEGQSAEAGGLLDRLGTGWGRKVDVRAAEVRLGMVRADHDAGPPEVAAALAEVGQQALWAREFALAVARYTEALEVKPDEGADSMRSLADALLSDAWTQPLEKADSVLKALRLCADAASLSPVDASTAWSLEVEHKAHGLLAGLERPDRVEHMWLAASASARSVAFDPSSADRWTWLGYRLTSLGAYHCADVAARRAVALGDDSIDTRDLRAVTALNLWQPDTAATFLAARESDSDDDKAWVAALNAMTYRARRDAVQAAAKMKDAVDLEPSEVLYRRWRAELLSIAGDPQATTEWRQIWRDADLETLDGLYAATLAATHQGLLASAKELAERLNSTQVMTAGDRTGLLVRGLTRLADRDEQGWADIRETLDWEIVAESVQEVGQSVGAMLRSAGLTQVAEAPRRVAALVDDRVAQIRATFPNGDGEGRASADAELVWFAGHAAGQQLEDVVKDAAEAVRVAFDLSVPAPEGSPEADGSGSTDGSADVVDSGDQGSTDVPEAPILYLGVPRKWFEGFEGRELTHDIFTRALPDARAWARRVRPLVNQWPSVQVWPDDSGSDSMVTQTTDGAQTAFLVHRPAWYCPPNWLAALPAERREKATPNPSTGFYVLPEPTTPIEHLTCWTAEDVAARLTLLAEAAVAEKVTGEEPAPQ